MVTLHTNVAKIYCKYCKNIITDSFEALQSYHTICQKEFDNFQISKNDEATDRFLNWLNDHVYKNVLKDEPVITKEMLKNITELSLFQRDTDLRGIIPEEISLLKNITKLKFLYFSDLVLPDSMLSLKELRILELIDIENQIIPAIIFKIDNLEYLRLQNFSNIQSLPNDLLNLKNLIELKVQNTNLLSVPNLNPLRKLKKVTFEACGLEKIPNLYDLPHLEYVDLSDNKIIEITKNIFKLKKTLNRLKLYGNNIEKLPKCLFDLKLIVLEVDQNSLPNSAKKFFKKCNKKYFKLYPEIKVIE